MDTKLNHGIADEINMVGIKPRQIHTTHLNPDHHQFLSRDDATFSFSSQPTFQVVNQTQNKHTQNDHHHLVLQRFLARLVEGAGLRRNKHVLLLQLVQMSEGGGHLVQNAVTLLPVLLELVAVRAVRDLLVLVHLAFDFVEPRKELELKGGKEKKQ